MSSTWIDQVRSSHNLQLAATAVASGLLVGSAILGLQKAKQQYRVSDLKSSIPDLDKDENVIQINNFGGAVQEGSRSSKEDERGAALAARARLGDYDE
ncbi:hypothetical protein KCU66_g21297, partial [Aureobasidium melanogenum]